MRSGAKVRKSCRSRQELSPVNGSGDVGDQSKDDAGKGDDKDNRSGRGQKKLQDGHGKKEAKGAASKRGRKDSSGDQRIACKKVKPK